MATYSVSSLQRMSAKALSDMMLAERDSAETSFAVIDVRDDDYIGGHIKGSKNIPIRTLDAMMPTLVRQLNDKKIVVFHCALSQQRGPSAALKYLREKGPLMAKNKLAPPSTDGGEVIQQQVFVLDRGFVGWQEVYGEDERLTEGYRKELWKDGYWG